MEILTYSDILDHPDSAIFAKFKKNSQARQGISLLKMCYQDSITLQNAFHPKNIADSIF